MTGKRDIACPSCGLFMRRIYIQQMLHLEDDKRKSKWVPIGYACLKCKSIIWDEEPLAKIMIGGNIVAG